MSTPALSGLGIGLQPYILNHIKNVVGTNQCPEMKIDNLGVINYLQTQDKPTEITTLNRPGNPSQTNVVQVKYLQRFIPAMTTTTDSCTVTNNNAYREASVTTNIFRQLAIQIDDSLLQRYTTDAVAMANIGGPATPVMGEFITQVIAGSNAILQALNRDLGAVLYANIGTNRVTGNNAAQTVNIPVDTTNLALNGGITKVLTDYTNNLGYGKPHVIGNGLIQGYFQQQRSKGNAQNGLNSSIESGDMMYHQDVDSVSLLGANQFITLQPNVAQIVETYKYKGVFAGYKGNSYFFTMMLPYQATPNQVEMVEFDAQLKYFDCPGNVMTDAYYGTSLTVGRGWNLILSKTCGLFQIPQDAYRAADDLFGNNGILRYTLTNV